MLIQTILKLKLQHQTNRNFPGQAPSLNIHERRTGVKMIRLGRDHGDTEVTEFTDKPRCRDPGDPVPDNDDVFGHD